MKSHRMCSKKPLPPTNSVLHLSRTSKTWSLVEKFILSLPRRSNIKLEFKQKKSDKLLLRFTHSSADKYNV